MPLAGADPGSWTFGEPAFDAKLPGGCLDTAALHEIKPAAYGDWPAALALAAGLAARRCSALEAENPGERRPILWCAPVAFKAEHGGLYGAGLTCLGLAPEAMIAVEAARETDVLWSLEEGVRSRALSLAVGVLKEAGLTPSRRLGLAAAAAGTPVLLLTLPDGIGAPTAVLRLRASRRPSTRHPFDGRAPGTPRFGVNLERCRGGLPESEGFSLELEWCDVTHRFRMAAGLADRADATAGARQRAGR